MMFFFFPFVKKKKGITCIIIAPCSMVFYHLAFLASSWIPSWLNNAWHYSTSLPQFLHIKNYESILVIKPTNTMILNVNINLLYLIPTIKLGQSLTTNLIVTNSYNFY